LTPPLFLFVVGVATSIAFDIQFEDRRVVNEAVDGGEQGSIRSAHNYAQYLARVTPNDAGMG